jgi:hypothetical protein
MKMYLLLRNNKQSGPHSADELKSMGLKAYDLVWLEGKSAAWRYPSEIEELSSFAPAVEEQPFDRFYKKPSPAASVTTSTTAGMPVVVDVETQSQRSSPLSSPTSTGKRIIYVTMPAGKSPAAVDMSRERRENTREIPRESTVRELPPREPASREPSAETHPDQESRAPREPIVRETSPSYARAAIEDYSAQPPSAQTTIVDYLPRRRSDKKTAITRFVAIGLCILALLAAGIFIGLSLNKDTLGLQHKMVANANPMSSVPPASPTSGAVSGVSPVTIPNGTPTNAGQRVDNPATIVHPTAQQLPAPVVTTPSASTRHDDPIVNTSTAPAKPVKKNQKAKEDHSAHGGVQYTTAPAPKDSATTTIPTMQREAVHRSDNAEKNHTSPTATDKEALRTALANQVSVGANTYSVGTFGGISDLQVTVTNRSAYPLDLVVVTVQYIQANKKVFKTENLYFRSIGAGSALMLEAPKSSRGIKVQYKVTTINSRELGLPGA